MRFDSIEPVRVKLREWYEKFGSTTSMVVTKVDSISNPMFAAFFRVPEDIRDSNLVTRQLGVRP